MKVTPKSAVFRFLASFQLSSQQQIRIQNDHRTHDVIKQPLKSSTSGVWLNTVTTDVTIDSLTFVQLAEHHMLLCLASAVWDDQSRIQRMPFVLFLFFVFHFISFHYHGRKPIPEILMHLPVYRYFFLIVVLWSQRRCIVVVVSYRPVNHLRHGVDGDRCPASGRRQYARRLYRSRCCRRVCFACQMSISPRCRRSARKERLPSALSRRHWRRRYRTSWWPSPTGVNWIRRSVAWRRRVVQRRRRRRLRREIRRRWRQ